MYIYYRVKAVKMVRLVNPVLLDPQDLVVYQECRDYQE